MPRTIKVIFNTLARKAKKGKIKPANIEGIIGKESLIISENPRNSLRAAVEECYKEEAEIIGVAGGDGTKHLTLTEITKVYGSENIPPTALLALGTSNGVVKGLRLNTNPIVSCKKLAEYKERPAEALETIDLNTLMIDENDSRVYGFMFAAGTVATFLDKYYEKSTGEPDLVKATKLIAKGIVSKIFNTKFSREVLTKLEAEMLIDKARYIGAYGNDVIFVSSMAPNIAGLKPFHPLERKGKQGDFYIAVVESITTWNLIRNLPRAYAGTQFNGIYTNKPSDLIIRPGQNYRYTIDGEMYDGTEELNITKGPVLKVIKL